MNSFSCFWLMIAFITWNSNLVPLFAIVLIINMISNDFPLNFLRQQLVVTRSLMPQRTVAQNSILSHLIRSDTSNPMNKFRTYPTRLFWAICTITPALKTWSRGGSGDLASRSGLCETSIGDSGLIWWCVQRRRRCFRLHISAKAAGAQEVRLCFQRRGFVAVVAFESWCKSHYFIQSSMDSPQSPAYACMQCFVFNDRQADTKYWLYGPEICSTNFRTRTLCLTCKVLWLDNYRHYYEHSSGVWFWYQEYFMIVYYHFQFASNASACWREDIGVVATKSDSCWHTRVTSCTRDEIRSWTIQAYTFAVLNKKLKLLKSEM